MATSPDSQSDPALRSDLLQRARQCESGLELAQLARKWSKIPPPDIHLKILSEGTAETFVPQLRLMSASRGHDFAYQIGTFNGITQDILDPDSVLYQSRTDLALIHVLPERLKCPSLAESSKDFIEAARKQAESLLNLCKIFHDRTGAQVILTNYEQPWIDAFAGLPASSNKASAYVRKINEFLGALTPSFVHLLDVYSLSSSFGRDRWHDPRMWHHAKQPMSFDAILVFARKFAGLMSAIRGTSSKCLVLDLDNTLWGGVVGEEGVESIRLGEGSAEGEAYRSFQHYLKGLKERGVMLAICSKNDPDNAKKPFQEHTEMVLKLEDICCFIANWESKADNCLRIARELNILPDALVFLDDEKAEREIVRQFAPRVKVLDLPADPSLFPRMIESQFLFESIQLTAEDLARTSYYQTEKQRKDLEETATDLNSFLQSLNMQADICPYQTADISRISQLFNKSNQFNLCTVRYSEKEIRDLIEDGDVISFQIRLTDKFGEYGLVSMAHAKPVNEETVRLANWIMSCRVLKRGVEHLMCNHLIAAARSRGFKRFEFDYRPSSKNSIVQNLYKNLGFKLGEKLDENGERWFVQIDSYQPFPIHIGHENGVVTRVSMQPA